MNILKLNAKEDKPFTLKDLGIRQYAILVSGPNRKDDVGQVIFYTDLDDAAVVMFTASNLIGFAILNEYMDRYIVRPLESGESFEITINEE